MTLTLSNIARFLRLERIAQHADPDRLAALSQPTGLKPEEGDEFGPYDLQEEWTDGEETDDEI